MALALCLGRSSEAAVPNYQDDVLPLFKTHCLSCHNADEKEADLDLSTFAALQVGSSGGSVVRAGSPDSSSIYRAVSHADDVAAMPPNQPRLSEKELGTVREWIAGGLLANSGAKSQLRSIAFDVGAGGMGRPEVVAFPRKLAVQPLAQTATPPSVLALASHPWSRLIAVSGNRQVLLYGSDPEPLAGPSSMGQSSAQSEADGVMAFLGVLDFPEGDIHQLRFSASGNVLLVAGGIGAKSGRVVLYDVATGDRVATLGDEYDSILAADISPDHEHVVIGTTSKWVKIHSTRDGKLLHRIKKHTDWVTAVRFSPDGKQIASADRNGGLYVWETHTAGILFTLDEHREAISSLDWRGDGKVLASGGDDGKLVLWDMNDGWATRAINAHVEQAESRYSRRTGVMDLIFLRDGRLVTIGRDRRLKIWQANGAPQGNLGPFTSLPLQIVSLPPQSESSRISGRVHVGGLDGNVTLWDLDRKQPLSMFSTLGVAVKRLP